MTPNTTIFENTQDHDTLGGRLHRSRDAAGLSVKDLSRSLGTSIRAVQNWENDRSAPSAHRIATIAGLLGVSLSWLLHGLGTAPAENEPRTDFAGQRLEQIKALHAETGRLIHSLETDLSRLTAAHPA